MGDLDDSMNIKDDRMSLEHILQRLRQLNETLSEQADSAQRRNAIGHATGTRAAGCSTH